MKFYEENLQTIVAYFRQGAQSAPTNKLGVEVEHFAVHTSNNAPVYYDESHRQNAASTSENTEGSGELNVAAVLKHLSQFYEQKLYGIENDLIGLKSSEASITLEPAAQLEISIAPFASIDKIVSVYNAFRQRVDPFLEAHGCKLITLGYHPSTRAADLPLIPKKRYRLMDKYFNILGTEGKRMMRASASVQVSVDYTGEADAIRKMRIAQALAPILSCICDNVCVFESKPTNKRLERFCMWRDVDTKRCCAVPGLFSEGYNFETYAKWLLETSPIFVTHTSSDNKSGLELEYVGNTPAYEAYSTSPMTQTDVEHLLSMFWPDVRLKNFIEIRPADSMEINQVAGYAALIKGLFYSEEAMQKIENALGVKNDKWPFDNNTTDATMNAIRKCELNATFAGKTVAEWVHFLFEVAKENLSSVDTAHLGKLENWFYAQARNMKQAESSAR